MMKLRKLGLKGENAENYFVDIFRSFNFDEKCVSLFFNGKHGFPGAGCDNTDAYHPVVVFGMYGLFDMPFHKVSNLNFTRGCVAMAHECRHVQQSGFGDDSNFPLTEKVLLSHMAYRNNDFWYKQNYLHMPFEIDAEFYGIIYANNWLSERFGAFQAETMILDYINDRMHNLDKTDYFIGKKPDGTDYAFLDEVYEAFDQSMEHALATPHRYVRWLRSVQDDAVKGLDLDSLNAPWWDTYYEMNDSHITGLESDKRFACFSVYVRPEDLRFYPALRDTDLRPETVFGHSFPESAEAVRSRVIKDQQDVISKKSSPPVSRSPGFTAADAVQAAWVEIEEREKQKEFEISLNLPSF